LNNLLTYCVLRSTQPPTLSGTGNETVAYRLQGEGLVWLIGEVVYLSCGSNCLPSWAMDGRIMCHGIISSCQSAATSETVNRCWSLVYSCKQHYSKYPDIYLLPFVGRPTKSPASRRKLPHFEAISHSPAASGKSPAFLALNLAS